MSSMSSPENDSQDSGMVVVRSSSMSPSTPINEVQSRDRRLFIRGFPVTVSESDLLGELNKLVTGLLSITLDPSLEDPSKNRGYCFVEFESHETAEAALDKLANNRVKFWGHSITSYWANPEGKVDETLANVFIRHLTAATTEEGLRAMMNNFLDKDAVKHVKRMSHIAFVEFNDRPDAKQCIEAFNGTILEGRKIDVCWARKTPAYKQKQLQEQRNRTNSNIRSHDNGNVKYTAAAMPVPLAPGMLAPCGTQAPYFIGNYPTGYYNGIGSLPPRYQAGLQKPQLDIKVQGVCKSAVQPTQIQSDVCQSLELFCANYGLPFPMFYQLTDYSNGVLNNGKSEQPIPVYAFTVIIPGVLAPQTSHFLPNIFEAKALAASMALRQLFVLLSAGQISNAYLTAAAAAIIQGAGSLIQVPVSASTPGSPLPCCSFPAYPIM